MFEVHTLGSSRFKNLLVCNISKEISICIIDQKCAVICSSPRSDFHSKMATTYFLAISDPVLIKQKCIYDIS